MSNIFLLVLQNRKLDAIAYLSFLAKIGNLAVKTIQDYTANYNN
jgi:hypothetical protein